MKVLVFNGSPKMGKGNTALLLTPFIEGIREAGAEVELFYTRKLEINYCTGEANCWVKTPGKCYQNDDMQMLYPKLREADVWVYATPVYWDGVTGPIKNLIDRTALPLCGPWYEIRDDHTRTSRREGSYKPRKIVLISTGGQWEMDIFDPLLVYFDFFCRNSGDEFAGALLRPHANGLRDLVEGGILKIDDILEAAKEAGRQLVKDGKMSTETLKIISRELYPRDAYVEGFNQAIQQALDAIKE